jgi:DNA repair photolyase
LEETGESGADAQEHNDPQHRHDQSQRQTARKHQYVNEKNVDDDRTEQGQREWDVAIDQEQDRRNDLEQKYRDQIMGDKERPDELASRSGRRRAPDAEWGNYVLLRPWDEQRFLASLRSAENTPRAQLKPDGNRAVIYCSTTDPYQVIRHSDSARQRDLAAHARFVVRRSLELIRDQSTLNVRILTRSPLARADFDLFASFGRRLVFGMSLPTLRNDLAKAYEPKAPAPSQRLATLRAAKEAGLHVYVALAPTYPECDEADLRATLKAVAELDPITIFHEPINIRAENVARIEAQAADTGVHLRTDVFATRESWQNYAIDALHTVSELAAELGVEKHLHLWPDKSLGSQSLADRMSNPRKYLKRLEYWWSRVSEWPQ